ncbi:hypothetical protein D8674_004708 [Pyrus ussuriensis x Pyrus communis]|uniref:Uncharacterized protein n=1 Tax=Pyrus ussuriensis x Pyrus communis TaxID=2448454 RepID=A0A5N5FL60_9ROSA|nr:hypothetical protein D8674_004708 [Pyrus ussuriensis x Pyrus communis]
MTLTTVEDEYSRAMLVLDQKFDFRFRLIAFFLLVLQVCLAVEDEDFEKMVCGIQKADVACENCGQILSNEIRLLEVRGAEFFPYLRTSETYCISFFSSSFLRMSGPSDRRLDLNAVEERPSFLSPTGPLTIGDSVMKNDMTATVVAKNLLTPKDNKLLSKRSDELAVKDSLAFSVQCAGSVSNMAQRLFARTRQVESLAVEVISLKQEIRGLKHENRQLHMLAHNYAITMKRKLDQLQESEGQILNDHQRFMSESRSSSDEGSPSSSSRFELAMLESSGPLLESCTKETLDDFHNCQTLANIASSSFMSVGEGVVLDAIPIFRSEFTTDFLEKNLLDSENQLEDLRQSCKLPFEPPKGHVMFYTQILLTLGVKLPLHPWLQRMLSFIGYASGQLNPGFWDTLIGFYIIWMECGLSEPSFHQWRYCYKMRPMKACSGYVECVCQSERERIVFVTRGNIKLSGRELADVEKVLRVPKEDRHLGFQPLMSECQRRAMEKVSKKGGTSTNKGKAPMLVPVDDILFHKGAHKHRLRLAPRPKSQEEVLKITASKRAEAEVIGYANNCLAGCRSTVDELGEPLDENESDRDRMMRLSSLLQVISVPWMAKGLAIGAPQLVRTRATDANNFKRSTGTIASVPKASENEVSPVEVRYEVKTSLVELVINDQVTGILVSNMFSLDFIIWESAMNKEFINWGDPAIPLLQDGEGFRQVGNVLVSMFAFD